MTHYTYRRGLLPPGPKFILNAILPSLVLPPLLTYLFTSYILPTSSTIIIYIPRPLLLIVSPIVWSYIRSSYKRVHNLVEARRAGAVLVPRVNGKYPGNVDILMNNLRRADKDYMGTIMAKYFVKFGKTFSLAIFGEERIVTFNVNHIKTILATDFPNYVKGDAFIPRMQSVLGIGVFNSDGELWKFHRAMARPFFSRDRISDFDIFARHSDYTIQLLKERFRTGQAVDFQDLTARFTLDSATEFLFGSCFHSLSSTLPLPANSPSQSSASRDTHAFASAFMEAQTNVSKRNRIGFIWPLFEFFKDRTEEHMKVIYEHIDPVLDEALAKKKRGDAEGRGKGDEGSRDTFLDHLVDLTDDRILIRDAIVNMLVAGRDTTSSTLTFSTYMLAMHPDVLLRLRQEVLEHIGSSQLPTYESLREMKYLRSVINETLRLFPPVPFNIRENINATTWKEDDGKLYYIPAKTVVSYSVLRMQRDPLYWGPDSQLFDPDRWLDSRFKTFIAANPFVFLPFNAGPRICLGQQFAYNEVSFFLVRLVQNFESITLAPEAHQPGTLPPPEWSTLEGRPAMEKITPKSHFTLYSKGGLWLKMSEARDKEGN